ncbi:hypothetical protein CerSpe_245600 [Prunus speciosa]
MLIASQASATALNYAFGSRDCGKHHGESKKNIRNLAEKGQKKFGPFLDLCVSSLRRGHANLLCIVPILSDVPEGTSLCLQRKYIKNSKNTQFFDVGESLLGFNSKLFSSWAFPRGFNNKPNGV